MKRWVMDCSIAAALGLPDEQSGLAEAFLEEMPECEVWAPSLWWHEIGNVVVSARRRGRITDADAAALLSLYGALPLHTDTVHDRGLLERVYRLASMYNLSAYDAAYLELAERKQAGLATLDSDLQRAATACGVALYHQGKP